MSRRAPRPGDLLSFVVPSEPRISPDGSLAVVTLQSTTRRADAYRRALWAVPTDGSAPARRLTIGAKNDRAARFSPDGRTLAFLSDRRALVEEAPGGGEELETGAQIHLLPLSGGEARRLSDLPREVEAFAWSPDGRSLVAVSSARGTTVAADRKARGLAEPSGPDAPLDSDYRFFDRLGYQYNGRGFVHERVAHLWLIDAATGAARQLTDAPAPDAEPAWSPDGRLIVFSSTRARDHDLVAGRDLYVVEVATGRVTAITGGARGDFGAPVFLPDGRIAALGHRFGARAGSRADLRIFAADGSDAHAAGGMNVTARHDLMPGSSMNSDLTIGEVPLLSPAADGSSVVFSAPVEGSYELWRVALPGGSVERITRGEHYLSGWDRAAGRGPIAVIRSSPTELPDLWLLPDGDRPGRRDTGAPMRRLTAFNEAVLADLELQRPETRWVESDGRRIQGWYLPPAPAARPAGAAGPAPLVVEIHGGPHTLYGWSPGLEFQVLAGAGIGVWYSNPRGSEGYGEAFDAANYMDWGDGPMRDVLAGVDALVAAGRADPERLGVTGGSYGGYLTTWIVAKDQRFAAALTARSVADLRTLMMTGDISDGEWGTDEFGSPPWSGEPIWMEQSPLTHAGGIRTPLLIQHAEQDLRCTIAQAEMLFTFLRSHRRPVRLMRVPGESHELTRSGTPFRRVENLRQVHDWFAHFLVAGKRRLPPIPRRRSPR